MMLVFVSSPLGMAVRTPSLAVTHKHHLLFSKQKRGARAPVGKFKEAPPGAFLMRDAQNVRPSVAPNEKLSVQAWLEMESVALG